jgi:non-ribosomal peptide synthetase-like protein
VALTVALRTIPGLRWLTWTAASANVARSLLDVTWLPQISWWAVALGWLLLISPPGRILLTAAGARTLLRNVAPGEHPRGGTVHLRLWFTERLAEELGVANLTSAPWMRQYARALGARVGRDVDLQSIPPVTGMLTLGSRCAIEPEVDLSGYWIDGDVVHLGPISVGKSARVGARSALLPGASIGAGAEIAPGSAVFGDVPADEAWSGAPARRVGTAKGAWKEPVSRARPAWVLGYAAMAILISLLPLLAILAGAAVALPAIDSASSVSEAALAALLYLPLGVAIALVVLALLIWLLVRVLSVGIEGGYYPVRSLRAWQAWSVLRVLDEARTWLFPLYSSSLTPWWLRALGARVGSDVEASTVLMLPTLTSIGDGAFLADDTLIGGYELNGGWMRIERVKVGKHAFVGNSGMTAPGRKVPKRGLVAVLSAAPKKKHAKTGTSWIGSPPTKLRRDSKRVDESRTYHPPTRLRVGRAAVEVLRLVPVILNAAIGLGVVVTFLTLASWVGWAVAALVSGVVMVVAGAVAAGITTGAKWLLVGRLRASDHPLWSAFVWLNELADTFVEVMAAPWFARPTTGTAVLNLWLSSMGAKIGKGVWCETYWLPEADLIDLRDGATINRGCVVQTHLFHDRMLSMDRVTLRAGATLGPNSVILPAAVLGRHATVGPVSLVMRGELVPDKTRWIGNPIGPWTDDDDHRAGER